MKNRFLPGIMWKNPLLLLAATVFFLFAGTSALAADCHRITAPASMPATADYAPPYNVLSSTPENLIRVDCGTSIQVTAGKTGNESLVYQQGYTYNGSWQSYAFSGSKHPNSPDWIVGTGTGSISTSGLNLAADNFLVAYVCQLSGGQWKCGCRDAACSQGFWQIQVFNSNGTTPGSNAKNQMTVAGNHTFQAPSGGSVSWKVDRLTATEGSSATPTREANVFSANGATASFDLTKVSGKETIYEITTSGNGANNTFTVQVFPANTMASFMYKSSGNPDVRVFVVVPQSLSPTTHLISVHHGNSRDADSYLSSWTSWVSKNNYIGIAPLFPDANWTDDAYNLGNIFTGGDGAGSLNPKSKWSYTIANDIAVKTLAGFGLNDKTYDMFGHSAGGQFTHRFMAFMPEAPIRLAFPANPGWWTAPSLSIEFPYGLKSSKLTYSQQDLLNWTNRKMIVVRGMDDLVRDADLRVTTESDAQGPNRFTRAKYAFDMAKSVNPSLAWELLDVPNCAHSQSCTAAAVQKYLEAHPAN